MLVTYGRTSRGRHGFNEKKVSFVFLGLHSMYPSHDQLIAHFLRGCLGLIARLKIITRYVEPRPSRARCSVTQFSIFIQFPSLSGADGVYRAREHFIRVGGESSLMIHTRPSRIILVKVTTLFTGRFSYPFLFPPAC